MSRPSIPLVPAPLRWVVVVIVAGTILVASVTRPGSVGRVTGPLGLVGLDKWLHAFAYAGLATTLAYALAGWDPFPAVVTVFAAAVAFGCAVELLQLPLAYRQFSGLDLIANAAGATVVAVTWGAISTRVGFRRVRVPVVSEE